MPEPLIPSDALIAKELARVWFKLWPADAVRPIMIVDADNPTCWSTIRMNGYDPEAEPIRVTLALSDFKAMSISDAQVKVKEAARALALAHHSHG